MSSTIVQGPAAAGTNRVIDVPQRVDSEMEARRAEALGEIGARLPAPGEDGDDEGGHGGPPVRETAPAAIVQSTPDGLGQQRRARTSGAGWLTARLPSGGL